MARYRRYDDYDYDEYDEYDYDEYDDEYEEKKPPRKAFIEAQRRVRALVLDNEKPVFKNATNRFFYDLCGVREFATDSFSIGYSRKAIKHMKRSIDRIGSARFVDMMLDEQTYNIMRNLVVICAQLQANAYKDKDAKEALDVYHRYIERIKKNFGIRGFSGLSTIVDPIKNLKRLNDYDDYYDYDDDDDRFDDYYDRPRKRRRSCYDDDEYDEYSIADAILGNPRGERRKPKKQQQRHECKCHDRDDADDDDDFVTETTAAVNKLAECVETLNNRMQALEASDDDEIHVSAKPSMAFNPIAAAYADEPEPKDLYADDIRDSINEIKDSLKDLAIDYGKTKKVTHQLISDFKSLVSEDDEDDGDDSPGDTPRGGGTLTEMTGGVITDPKQLT